MSDSKSSSKKKYNSEASNTLEGLTGTTCCFCTGRDGLATLSGFLISSARNPDTFQSIFVL
eukprot:snap_masked-scaffold_9-processed-gene-10.29-mRNA-1 protein AED:1.00 eAED:1.00 QI:0/-1/0/0/-1/1/1/0/60